MSAAVVCLAFGTSLDEQGYPGEDYARAVFGPFDDVRACYGSMEGRTRDGWEAVAVWDGSWWRVPYRPDLPGFSDVEIRGDA
jgi:hypothetical protein